MIPTTTRSETRAETGYRTTKQKEKQPAPPHRATKILQYILHANFEYTKQTSARQTFCLKSITSMIPFFFFFFTISKTDRSIKFRKKMKEIQQANRNKKSLIINSFRR